ncbi:MAG: TerB family tellurite resistance protein [Myxococcales bacterium]|nr:TerB family tellurite resistance protein [Myxococcales bacterium]MBL0196725.1 TerB family tellurite resistance protein [Myxococcales bacterium]HQY64485.1 TerB family tellurite resistance protein [Polyangiaceae bacterium]
MHEQQIAIVKGLVPVAWADGDFGEKEREAIGGLLAAYGASEEEKKALFDYAGEKRTLDDINLQDLSASDRRVLLQTAVVISFVDGEQSIEESTMLVELASRLRIPDEEAKTVISEAAARAKQHLGLL